MDLEFRHLELFLIVAEEGHVTRAAERLGVQQPPLSQRIKAIERTLQVQLLRRKGRGIELTDAGRALYEHARLMLDAREVAIGAARRAARGEEGRLRIGVTPTGLFHPLVQTAIRTYRERHPRVSLVLEECLRTELMERLHHKTIDVAFLRSAGIEARGFEIRPLQVEALVAALPTGHRLARSVSDLHMLDLREETFIVYARQHGPAFYEAMLAACHKTGFMPRIGQEAPRITSALSLVAAGLGIAVVPASMQQMNINGLVYRGIKPMKELKAVLNLASRRDETSAIVRNFQVIVGPGRPRSGTPN